MENKKNHYEYISWLNVISAISVVILHANKSFWHYRDEMSWIINTVVTSVFYFAVPVFFMITGVTLIDYNQKYDTKTYFKKRFSKTVIPFLFWSVIAVLLHFKDLSKEAIGKELSFYKIFNGVFHTDYIKPYWFFIPLFCIYLSMPLFANIVKEKKLKIFNYLVCVSFIINILLPFVIDFCNALFDWDLKWNFEISVLSGYLFYVIVGYLLHQYKLNKNINLLIILASAVGFMILLFGTIYLSNKHGSLKRFFQGYNNLPCVLYSIGVFVLGKNIFECKKLKKYHKYIIWLQKYTFGIYLIHMVIFDPIESVLNKLNISNTTQLFVVLMTIINIISCIIITAVLRKIPILIKVVP